MFLPAMLDLFKRYGLKSVFMGAGNAHYTAAASAMADNVVFCWRDRLNKKDDSKNSTVQKKNDSKNSTDQEKEFLMVYVDRTAGRIGREGRALYKLEIEGNKVKLPESRKKLDRSICRADEASEFDVTSETVTRIIQLQGV
ncbi:MAG: hypothetical protein GWP06_13390 [Actinobacteria bacterium]|nr:hypothetical protein [Actinomycetota bacterium]